MNPGTPPIPERRLSPLGIALIYLGVSAAYIVGSTLWIFAQMPDDVWDIGEQIELVKGLVFVTLSAWLIWWLVRRLTRQLEAETARAATFAETNRQLFDTMPEPAWVYDDQTLKFLEVNDAAIKRYGWSRNEFLTMTIRQIRPVEDLAQLEQALQHKQRGRHDSGVFRHMDKHGRIFRVGVTAQSLDYSGRLAWLVVAWSVEELVTAQETVERLNRELEQRVQDRTRGLRRALAELEWFTETVSHDLRRPVAHLGELARSLALSVSDRLTAEEAESAHRIVGGCARLENLVEDLLAVSRSHHGASQIESVSLAVLANSMLGQLRRDVGTDAKRVAFDEPLFWVRAHRATLARVVTGLLTLALRDSTPRSVVRLSATADGREVRLTFAAPGEWLRPEDRARLAPALETSVHGTGEVAVIVRSVWRIGGELECRLDESTSPPTCLVTLTLPQATPAEPSTDNPVAAQPV